MRNSSRRAGLTLALVLLCTLVMPAAAQDQPSEALVIGTTAAIVNFDPADADDLFTWEILTHLYTGLTRQIPGTLDYELALAESHTVSDDGLTHTFAIRGGATFNDGTPITAQTFADSINRVLSLGGRGKAIIAPYLRAAEVDEAGALALRLNTPVPFIMQLVALPPFFPLHPRLFPLNALNRTPAAWITNGVYRVASYELGRIALEADPTWQGDAPRTAKITLEHYDLPAELREALRSGAVHIAWRGLPPDDIDLLVRSGGGNGIKQITAPGLQTFYLLFTQRQPPYGDVAARRGMTYLIDRDRAVQVGLRGLGSPLYTLLPDPLTGPDDFRYPAYDTAAGKKALAEGGYSRFKRIESELQTSRQLYGDLYLSAADRIISGFTQEETIRLGRADTEARTFLDQIERSAFRLMIVGWTPLVPHPDAFLRPLLAGQLGLGAEYSNAEALDLLNRAALSEDTVQAALYAQAQAIAGRDIVAIPLWQNAQWLAAAESVEGIVIEPNFLLRYDRLEWK